MVKGIKIGSYHLALFLVGRYTPNDNLCWYRFGFGKGLGLDPDEPESNEDYCEIEELAFSYFIEFGFGKLLFDKDKDA